MSKQQRGQNTPTTVLTLTLPNPEGGIPPKHTTATLLVQRGELAHVRQFHYDGMLADLISVIREAFDALAAIEADPPIITEAPAPQHVSKPAAKPELSAEPTVDVPLKKGTKAVKISHLKIVGGETDAAAYRQAVLLAGKFIDGKLWDGETPIRFDDVYAVARKMQYLTERDLSLFTLADFVQIGPGGEGAEAESLRTAEPDGN